MGRLYRFYCDGERTASGLQFDQILRWPDSQLESRHNYIQWLFPLPERSRYNPFAPRLTEGERSLLMSNPSFSPKMRAAFERMLSFYGLALSAEDPNEGPHALAVRSMSIVPAASFGERSRIWLTPGNHNYLRLTRIMRSTSLLGFKRESLALFTVLNELYCSDYAGVIGERSYAYWRGAAGLE